MLREGTAAALLFTSKLVEGFCFIGEFGLGVEAFCLRDTVDVAFRTVGVLNFDAVGLGVPAMVVELPTRAVVGD